MTSRHSNGSLNLDSDLVLGVDPDSSGALELLKFDPDSGSHSATVYDSLHVQVLVGLKSPKVFRCQVHCSVASELCSNELKSCCSSETPAYIEQSNPFPEDGKQSGKSVEKRENEMHDS